MWFCSEFWLQYYYILFVSTTSRTSSVALRFTGKFIFGVLPTVARATVLGANFGAYKEVISISRQILILSLIGQKEVLLFCLQFVYFKQKGQAESEFSDSTTHSSNVAFATLWYKISRTCASGRMNLDSRVGGVGSLVAASSTWRHMLTVGSGDLVEFTMKVLSRHKWKRQWQKEDSCGGKSGKFSLFDDDPKWERIDWSTGSGNQDLGVSFVFYFGSLGYRISSGTCVRRLAKVVQK